MRQVIWLTSPSKTGQQAQSEGRSTNPSSLQPTGPCFMPKYDTRLHVSHPGGVLQEKLGGGVRPASQNPYPIYDRNLRNSLPYL